MVLKYANGIFIVTLATIASYLIQGIDIVKKMNFSSLIIAILIGALIKNTIGLKENMIDGIKFCSKKILRLAVIMLGFKLSLTEVSKIGLKAVILIIVVSTLTLLFTQYMGKKMKIPYKLSTLIGTGTSICGASAVAAANSIIKSEEEDVAFAIGSITLFGTIFMFFYPVLYRILNMDVSFYSMWAGSSIHEVAQVVAAGFAISPDSGTTATLVKLTRVLFIIPVTIYLSFSEIGNSKGKSFDLKKISIPWFVIMFLAVVIINSIFIIPKEISQSLITIDGYLMTSAMAALGLDLSFSNLKRVGVKPLYLGLMSSIFISLLSAVIVKLIVIA
ncbi:YeiH family protein [Biomaibacter acetigenes]|uniref:YeiH family protein n=1 Tax=Biomaibacter acetigenes TaxID=2316383 RepID=UPI0013CE8022|nr:YeiH family protein [Biomaibacter acetigenes]